MRPTRKRGARCGSTSPGSSTAIRLPCSERPVASTIPFCTRSWGWFTDQHRGERQMACARESSIAGRRERVGSVCERLRSRPACGYTSR